MYVRSSRDGPQKDTVGALISVCTLVCGVCRVCPSREDRRVRVPKSMILLFVHETQKKESRRAAKCEDTATLPQPESLPGPRRVLVLAVRVAP